MSKADAWQTGILNLLFKNNDFKMVGDAGGLRGSVVAGSLYFSLHTADPGETGDQRTNEVTFGGYARQGVERGAGFTVTGNSVSPAKDVYFPECVSAPGEVITHAGIGVASTGAGKLLYVGALTEIITVYVGVIPRIKSSSTVTEN